MQAMHLERHTGERQRPSLFADLASVADAVALSSRETTFPSTRWRRNPVGFARDVLQIELWSAQVEIVESIRDHRNTTVRSGHKCGKSTALAVAALWFFCSFDRARVLMTAVKASQIDDVIWKEIRRLYREAKIPVGGQCYVQARTGLRDDDGRQVWGITARNGEGLAGISGPNVLVLADEASGINDRFFEVLDSALAGSGGTVRKCYISNPTRTNGEFYRSHTTNGALFHKIHISSEETPNARGEKVIPGLAGPDWIREKVAEYGVDSHAYRVRVRGEFVHDRDGKIISLDLIAQAQAAWDESDDDGVLQLGADPAGDSVIGDESAFAVRRGNRIVTVLARRGMSEDEVVAMIADLIATHRRPRELAIPRVAIDAEGGVGARVLGKLEAYVDAHRDEFEIVPVRSGKKMWGSPEYDMVRDALWGQTQKWLLAGGSIPEDVKLSQELNAPSFSADKNARFVATGKKELRKELGRSTDRADAVCLAIWGFTEDGSSDEDDVPEATTTTAAGAASSRDDEDDVYGGPALDPWEGLSTWGRSR